MGSHRLRCAPDSPFQGNESGIGRFAGGKLRNTALHGHARSIVDARFYVKLGFLRRRVSPKGGERGFRFSREREILSLTRRVLYGSIAAVFSFYVPLESSRQYCQKRCERPSSCHPSPRVPPFAAGFSGNPFGRFRRCVLHRKTGRKGVEGRFGVHPGESSGAAVARGFKGAFGKNAGACFVPCGDDRETFAFGALISPPLKEGRGATNLPPNVQMNAAGRRNEKIT